MWSVSASDLLKQVEQMSREISDLHATLDHIGAYVFMKDLQGRYTFVNEKVRTLFAYPLDEIIGSDDRKFFSLDQSDDIMVNDRKVMREGLVVETEEKNIIGKTGEVRYYWSVKKPLYDDEGNISGMFGVSTDITERKLLELKLQESERLLGTVVNHVDAYIYMKNREHQFLFINQKTADLLGVTPEQAIGKSAEEFFTDAAKVNFDTLDKQLFAEGSKVSGEESFVDEQQQPHYFWSTKVPLFDDEDNICAYIGFSNEITELIALKKDLELKASIDDLTQIANRRVLLEQAEHEFKRAKRNNSSLVLLSIDVDFFKEVNDAFGHQAGDEVLKAIAGTCAKNLRDIDYIGRVGGEEFLALLPQAEIATAVDIAERLRAKVAEIKLPEPWQHVITPTISIGIAEVNDQDENICQLLTRADNALYCAKRSGRDKLCTLV